MDNISRSAFADLCGVSRSAISRAIGRHRVVVDKTGVDIRNPVNLHYAVKCLLRHRREGRDEEAAHLAAILAPYTDIDTQTSCPRARVATEAAYKITIASAKIKGERAKQEEIKTLERCRSLAPVRLISYFDGFCDDLRGNIDTLRALEGELSTLFTSGRSQQARQLIIRELEAIVVQCRDRLVVAIGKGSTMVS